LEPGVASVSESVGAWLSALDDDYETTASALSSLVAQLQTARGAGELQAGVLSLCEAMEEMDALSPLPLQAAATAEMERDPRLEEALGEAVARTYAVDELKTMMGALLTQIGDAGCDPAAARAVAARVVGADWQRAGIVDVPPPLLAMAQQALQM